MTTKRADMPVRFFITVGLVLDIGTAKELGNILKSKLTNVLFYSSIQVDFLLMKINHLKNQLVIGETSAAYWETIRQNCSFCNKKNGHQAALYHYP